MKPTPGGLFIPGSGNIGSLSRYAHPFGFWVRIVGFNNVMKGYEAQVKKIRGATYQGLIMAVEHLKESMNTVIPVVPVGNDIYDKNGTLKHRGGTLRDAFEYSKASTSNAINPQILFGYNVGPESQGGAPYAWYVHEMTPEAYGDINWTRPGSGPKWFEIALKREKQTMLGIVKQYAINGALS
jgi:hypothetical protein